MKAVPVLYLDLDGTVREGKDDALGHYVNSIADVRVFPEAIKQMRLWREHGGRICAITNQGGIALGYMTVDECVAAIIETQRQAEMLFDQMMMCKHHPDAADPEMARCWCRKPRAGLVVEGALELNAKHPDEIYPPHLALFVGDRVEDQECAAAANLDFMSAEVWRAGAYEPRYEGR